MTAADVHEALDALAAAGVAYRLDGGWGVDALVREETRPHDDLDVVVARSDRDAAEAALSPHGYAEGAEYAPGLPARVVLEDGRDRRVDLHLVVYDAARNGWQQLGGGAWGLYPASDLDASGEIGGRSVPCISAGLQLQHHLGYALRETERHDLALLAERCGVPLPPG